VTSKRNQLTDSAYIQWAKKKEWSLTQAVYLLHGLVPPPESEIAIDLLIKKFPRAKGLLQYYPKLNKNEKSNQECPDTWVFLAAMHYTTDEPCNTDKHYSMDLPICWDAIFPKWIKGNGGYDFGRSPDYRRFIEVFTRDIRSPLGKLAEYVLNLGKDAMANPPDEYFAVLDDMDTALGINAKKTRKLHEPSNHPKLAAWLKTSGKDENEPGNRRTRSDAIKTSMNAYLDECKTNNKIPELDECWRFTAERPAIEENHNGELVYPIRGGKDTRRTDRKRFSERFKVLLKDR